jgi:endonuclease/exonuclease/phosphatase family metal-dependent hydrolase
MHPDILCVQETYPSQLEDLQKSLGDSYLHFVGNSRTGELNAIFYNKERFELDLKYSSASLEMPISPKDDAFVATITDFLPPDLEPGKQLTLVHIYDKLTGKQFVVMNTHLTFYRVNSREAQAYFIADLVQKLHTLNKTVILTGDFNTIPNRPDKTDYHFYDGGYICQIFKTVLKDTKDAALLGHVGPLASSIRDFLYRGNKPLNDTENPEVILDHIYVSPTVSVLINGIEPCLVDDRFPSDHMPVIADILLP